MIEPDPDTGLPRRMEFEQVAYHAMLEASHENPVSLLLIGFDLESIPVEEKLGLRMGYELRRISEVISLHAGDVLATGKMDRLEFGVLLACDSGEAEALSLEICDGVRGLSAEQGKHALRTVSVGVLTARHSVQIESALNEARRCMIAAKAMGRDRVCTQEQLISKSVELGIPMNMLSMEYKIRVKSEQMVSNVEFQSRRTILDYINKAETDPLTGLHNRGYLDNRITREISNAHKHNVPLTFAIIDADDFGKLNNKYGLPVGDSALRLLASVLKNEIRSTDWVARYGGEEFCVVMPSTSLMEGVQVLERMRLAVSESSVPTSNGEVARFTISAGVIELAGDELEKEQLYHRASKVERIAKDAGKNRLAY